MLLTVGLVILWLVMTTSVSLVKSSSNFVVGPTNFVFVVVCCLLLGCTFYLYFGNLFVGSYWKVVVVLPCN